MDSSDTTITRNERNHQRVAPEAMTQVRVTVERMASVTDASSGGVGLIVDHPWGFNLGDQVLLWSEGSEPEPIDYAIVKNVVVQPDGRWRIGLQWETDEVTSEPC